MAKVVRHQNHLEKEMKRSPRTKLLLIGAVVVAIVLIGQDASIAWLSRPIFTARFEAFFWPVWVLYMFASMLVGQGKRRTILRRGLEGEQRTERLLSGLPDDYTVISDLTIHGGGKESQIDHVVVGPTGVFVIETKNLNGSITGGGDDHELFQHKVGRAGGRYGKSFYNPVKQVGTHVYRLSQFLKEHQIPTWVDGIVFFSNPEAQVHVKSEKTPVFSYREGPHRLLDYMVNHKGKGLSGERQADVVRLITSTLR